MNNAINHIYLCIYYTAIIYTAHVNAHLMSTLKLQGIMVCYVGDFVDQNVDAVIRFHIIHVWNI